MGLPKQLIDIDRIYVESTVENYVRGLEILAKYPAAERIPALEDTVLAWERGLG
jgi:hypothetical protein